MNRYFLIAGAIFALATLNAFCADVRRDDFRAGARRFYETQYSMDGEEWTVPVPTEWARGIPATVEFTSHGHGVFRMANLSFRVYDGNPDPISYRDECLEVEFLNGVKGERYLVVSGEVIWAEQRGPSKKATGKLLAVYVYHPQGKQFERVVSVIPFQPHDVLLERLTN